MAGREGKVGKKLHNNEVMRQDDEREGGKVEERVGGETKHHV